MKSCYQEQFNLIICIENLLKASLQNVLKASWRRFQNILNIFWKFLQVVFARHLEDVLERHLEKVLKMSSRWFSKTFWIRLRKMSRRCFEKNVLKTSWRHMTRTNILVLDALKTSSEYVRVRWTCLSWSRRLEDVLWRQRWKTFSRRLQDVFIKTNVCWEVQVIKIG